MSLHCGTSHIAVIFVLVLINIGCAIAIVTAVVVGGWGILIERGMW
jgi:hypothetical protein